MIARAGRRRATRRCSSRCGACLCAPPLHRLHRWRRATPRAAVAMSAAARTNAIAELVECGRALDEQVALRGSDAAAAIVNSMRGHRGCGWRGDPTDLTELLWRVAGRDDGLNTTASITDSIAKNERPCEEHKPGQPEGQATEISGQKRSQLLKCQSNFSSSKPGSRRSHQRKKKVWNAKALIVWHRWRNWPPQQGTRRHPHQKKLFPDSCKKARRWEDASSGAPAST